MSLTAVHWPAHVRVAVTVALCLSCWFFPSRLLTAIFCLLVVYAFYQFLRELCAKPRAAVLFFSIAGPVAVFLGLTFYQMPFMPYLAIISINLIVAYVFGHRLLRGQATVLEQFVQTAHLGPPLSKDFKAFLERQCALWFAAGLLSAAIAAIALVSEAWRGTAAGLLFMFFALQILWFGLSHEIACRRYKRNETWQQSLMLMMRRDTWKKLDV